jgi:hypothetical protein
MLSVDGTEMAEGAIPLSDDHNEHAVEVKVR